jgi:hypothetical protein
MPKKSIMSKRLEHKTFLIALFIFSFMIRGLFFIAFLSKNNNYWTGDSQDYYGLMSRLSEGKGLTNSDNSPYFERVPGYTYFMYLCESIFGKGIKKILWLNIFIAAFFPILIFHISLSLFPLKLLLAKIVSVYSAIHLGYFLNAGTIMSDSLFCFFFFIFIILFFRSFDLFFCFSSQDIYIKRGWLKRLFFAGVILGIASLIRPVGHFCIVIGILFLFFSKFNLLQKLKGAFLLLFGWLLVVSILVIRNFLLTGFMFFNTMPGIHFLRLVGAPLACEVYQCSYMDAKKKLLEEVFLKLKDENKNEISAIISCKAAEDVTLKYIKKRPISFLLMSLKNFFKTCFSLYSAELLYMDAGHRWDTYLKRNVFVRYLASKLNNKFIRYFIYFEILCLLFIMAGFLLSLFFNILKFNYLCVFLKVLPFIGLFIFLTLADGVARLRMPIEPFFFIFAFDFWIKVLLKKFSFKYEL